jgi:FtsH-binding integral membrane protein
MLFFLFTVHLCVCLGPLFLACLGNVLSIAFFNFFGLSVTKYMSATHRMVLDSLRTIIIWAVSLLVGWQSFR